MKIILEKRKIEIIDEPVNIDIDIPEVVVDNSALKERSNIKAPLPEPIDYSKQNSTPEWLIQLSNSENKNRPTNITGLFGKTTELKFMPDLSNSSDNHHKQLTEVRRVSRQTNIVAEPTNSSESHIRIHKEANFAHISPNEIENIPIHLNIPNVKPISSNKRNIQILKRIPESINNNSIDNGNLLKIKIAFYTEMKQKFPYLGSNNDKGNFYRLLNEKEVMMEINSPEMIQILKDCIEEKTKKIATPCYFEIDRIPREEGEEYEDDEKVIPKTLDFYKYFTLLLIMCKPIQELCLISNNILTSRV